MGLGCRVAQRELDLEREPASPTPLPVWLPVFPQASRWKEMMVSAAVSCDAANAGACAATAITGTVQAAPQTTVRRE